MPGRQAISYDPAFTSAVSVYLVPGPMFSFSDTIRSSGKRISTSVALEPLFSMLSVSCPAGADVAEVSHFESAAVTWIAASPSALLFSVHPVTAVRAAAVATAVTTESLAARMQAPEAGEKSRVRALTQGW